MNSKKSLFGLNASEQQDLFAQLQDNLANTDELSTHERKTGIAVPERFKHFKDLPAYKELQVHNVVARQMNIMNPFFTCHETKAKGRTIINGE